LDIPLPLAATGNIAVRNGIAAGTDAWSKMQFALVRFAF
jgi:hypothetical protein